MIINLLIKRISIIINIKNCTKQQFNQIKNGKRNFKTFLAVKNKN